MDVDALFGEPTVALRGPWSATDLVKIAPAADDLAAPLRVPPRLPGQRAQPGLRLRALGAPHHRGRRSRRSTRTSPPSPADPGKLALQYWLFYAFNDWNNLHEGDWEMIQLVFDATDAQRGARDEQPVEIGYSQHEGAERADWGDDKLELVDGTHPVVLPGRRLARELLRRGAATSAAPPSRASAATTRAAPHVRRCARR